MGKKRFFFRRKTQKDRAIERSNARREIKKNRAGLKDITKNIMGGAIKKAREDNATDN